MIARGRNEQIGVLAVPRRVAGTGIGAVVSRPLRLRIDSLGRAPATVAAVSTLPAAVAANMSRREMALHEWSAANAVRAVGVNEVNWSP